MTATLSRATTKTTPTRLARPGAVLFVVGIFLLLGGATAWACAPSTTARARPASGEAGTTTTVSGTGFAQADGPVSIYWGGTSGSLLATATVDAAGNFTQSVVIPDGAPGSYFMQAVQGTARSANFPFEVTASASEPPPPPPPAEPPPADPPPATEPPPAGQQPIAPQPVEMAPQPEQQPLAPQPQQPVANQPIALQPQQPGSSQPVGQQPQQPVAQQPVTQQPVAQPPVASSPVVLQPVIVQPVIERSVAVGSPTLASQPQAATTGPTQAPSAATPATGSAPSAGTEVTDGAVAEEAPTGAQESAVEPLPLTDDPDTSREVDSGGPAPLALISLALAALGVSILGFAALGHELRRTRARARG